MKKIEFSITHDGKEWVITNKSLTLSSPTLEELDTTLRRTLIAQGIVGKGERAKVLMAFDMATIPQWIRQYSQHYFNRVIWVEGDG